mgnify:CR=1 FL=1
MKIFHLSDLHIGLKLYNRDLLEDQKYVFDQIIKYAKEEAPDVILIAGDIYDKAVPSAEAVEVFDDFIAELANETTSTVMTIMFYYFFCHDIQSKIYQIFHIN